MRWLSRLLVVLVVCLVSAALPAAPAQANGAYITLSPSSGSPGEEVTIRGYNFTANEWVDIYYYQDSSKTWVAEVETDEDGDFRVNFEVPESYTGPHKVRAQITSTFYADADFTVEPGLTISPKEGPVDTNVTVEGHGFAEDEEGIKLRYYLDGNYTALAANIEANAYGWWKRSCVIPSSSKGNHKIDAEGDESKFYEVNDATFKVTPGISLDKLWGSPGDNITMTGKGFAANERDIKILFADEEVDTNPDIVRADATGYWQASFQVPEKPKGEYSVTADGESTHSTELTPVDFETKPGLVLSPLQGHVGTNLTVSGRGFAVNKGVIIKYDDVQMETTTTNTSGSFTAVFPVPQSQHGARTVRAEDAAGNNATAIFTMESDPPGIPELISPSDGSRVGFIGKQKPTLEWSEVSDDSGVCYSLQIATSANVTASGFADPIVSVLGIVGANYTLNATQALPYGKYYWIVQAVDRAGNAGNWTAPYSFRAGLLPLWAFSASVAVVAVIIGTALYFSVFRKRLHYY